jgi:adenosine deaminase
MREAFDYLAEHYLPTSVHAGEAAGLDSIRGAIFDGRSLRLGHGVRLAEDLEVEPNGSRGSRGPRGGASGDAGELGGSGGLGGSDARGGADALGGSDARGGSDGSVSAADSTYVTLGLLAQWVRDREIALELSPSSNLQTGAIAAWGDELIDHPFDLLYQLGFRVTVNTDNRLMSNTTLSRELALLAETFGYDLEDLETFQLNAAAASFLPVEEREELAELILAGFAAV